MGGALGDAIHFVCENPDETRRLRLEFQKSDAERDIRDAEMAIAILNPVLEDIKRDNPNSRGVYVIEAIVREQSNKLADAQRSLEFASKQLG